MEALTVLRGEKYVMDEEIQEMETIVKSEADESSKLSAFKSRTFLLPAFLITISYLIEVLSGIELCGYYVAFIFTNSGVSLEIAAIITQVSGHLMRSRLIIWIAGFQSQKGPVRDDFHARKQSIGGAYNRSFPFMESTFPYAIKPG